MAAAEQAAFDPVRPGRARWHRGVRAGHAHRDDRDLVALRDEPSAGVHAPDRAVAGTGALRVAFTRPDEASRGVVGTGAVESGLPVVAALVFIRCVPLLADTMSASPSNEEYCQGPGFLWTITLLDLGIALPATVAAVVGFRRGADGHAPLSMAS